MIKKGVPLLVLMKVCVLLSLILATQVAANFDLNVANGEIPGRIGIEVETGLAVGINDTATKTTNIILHGQPFVLINAQYAHKNASGHKVLKPVGIKAEADGVGDAARLTRVSHVEFVVDPPVLDRFALLRAAQVIQDGFGAAITALGDREAYCKEKRDALAESGFPKNSHRNELDAKLRVNEDELVDDIVKKDGAVYDEIRRKYGVTQNVHPQNRIVAAIKFQQANKFEPASVLKNAMVASAKSLYNDNALTGGTGDANHFCGINPFECREPYNRLMSEPQATAGFHVSRIPFLMKVLGNPQPYHAKHIARDGCTRCKTVVTLTTNIMTALKAADPFFRNYNDQGKALEALVTLTAFYINNGASSNTVASNVKITLGNPALVKNSFDHVFRLMPDAVKSHIRKSMTCTTFARTILDNIPNLKVMEGYDKYNSSLLSKGFVWFVDPDPNGNAAEKERLTIAINPDNAVHRAALAKYGRQAWIEGFCNKHPATDLLRSVKLKVKEVDPTRNNDNREAVIHDYATRLIRHSKMTGPEEKLIVIELRETATLNSPFNTITPWADAVYLAVSGIHTFDETATPAPFYGLEDYGDLVRQLNRIGNGQDTGAAAERFLKEKADNNAKLVRATRTAQSTTEHTNPPRFLEAQPSVHNLRRHIFRDRR